MSTNPGAEEEEARGASWKHEDLKLLKRSRLLDHPKLWGKAGISKGGKDNSRCKITQLPDPEKVALLLYCGNCTDIPFPWARNARRPLGPEEYPEGVFLCERGHAVCRTCYQAYYNCVLDGADLKYMFQKEDQGRLPGLAEFHLPLCVSDVMEMWGERSMCLAKHSASKGMLFTEIIKTAEFACKYFYNWCDFRGKGKALVDHEASCPFQNTSIEGTVIMNNSESAARDCSSEEEDEDGESVGRDTSSEEEDGDGKIAPRDCSSEEEYKDGETVRRDCNSEEEEDDKKAGQKDLSCDCGEEDEDDCKILKVDVKAMRLETHRKIWDILQQHNNVDKSLLPSYVLRDPALRFESK